MARELSDESLLTQAENYIAHESRHRTLDREAIFARWCESKDFDPDDREAIRLTLLGMGVQIRRAA